jgi:protein gp37
VSVENQRTADERIPILLQTPAAVRFVSAEPLLGPVVLDDRFLQARFNNPWLIVGCESGPGARPCDPAWVRSIIGQCREARVPVFVKQWRDPVSGKIVKMPEIDGKVYDEFPTRRE